MDLHLTDDQRLLRDSVREFAERELRPHVMAWDEAQHFPMALLPKLADLGLMGIQFPEHYGGAGMSAVDYCICIEELARVDPSVSLSVAALGQRAPPAQGPRPKAQGPRPKAQGPRPKAQGPRPKAP